MFSREFMLYVKSVVSREFTAVREREIERERERERENLCPSE